MALKKHTMKKKVTKLKHKKHRKTHGKMHKKMHKKTHGKMHKKMHGKTHGKKHGKKHRKSKRVQKGGFGPGACPQVGPSWNATKGGNYFSNGTPIGIGGKDPYFGDTSPAPQMSFSTAASLSGGQKGGSSANPLVPQPLLDAYRGILFNAQSMYNTIQGTRPPQGVLPWDQAFQQP